MDSLRLRKLNQQIKAFLFSDKSREFLIFLLFLVVAAAFWLLRTLNENYEAEIVVPMKLVNVPEGVVITEDLPSALHLKVKDRGTVLVGYFYGNELPEVQVDYTRYSTESITGSVQVPQADVQKLLTAGLMASTQMEQVRPDAYEFHYNKGVRKRLPVRLAGRLKTAPQYYLLETTFTPDSVWVYAPLTQLDTMQAVYTQPFDAENLNEDVTRTLSLTHSRGMKVIPAETELKLKVDVYTEKTVEVPVLAMDFPPTHDLRTFPGKVNVTFRVGAVNFKDIEADDFLLAVTYEELMENRHPKLQLKLKVLPEGVSHVRIHPSEVDYLIEQVADE